jgi:hypothetical protein
MALLLGFVSAGALASPLLWFLPLGGIVLAIVALWSIAQSNDAVAGRWAAVIGLVLSLTFITWAPCRYFVRHELLYRQAREHGEYWLGLVREGRLHEAHQLTLSKDERQPASANLNEIYLDRPQLLESFETFCQQSPMNKVIELGGKGRVRFVNRDSIESDNLPGSVVDVVNEQLAIDFDEGGQPRTLPVVLRIARSRYIDTGEASWFVRGIEDPSTLEN